MVRQWKATRSQRQRVAVGRVRGAHTVDGALSSQAVRLPNLPPPVILDS